MKSNVTATLFRSIPLLAAIAVLSMPLIALALAPGDLVKNVSIRDANDKPATIPFFGQRVITIFYTDADVSDQNDPFADYLKAADLPEDKHKGIGIANLKDAPWKPNSLIRAIIRSKIEKYDATILTDPDLTLAKSWNLGNCDELSVVIVIDKAGKVQYVKKGALSKAEMEKVLTLIKGLIGQ